MIKLQQRFRRDDSGLTLVELVVVMTIMGMLGAMLTTWFVSMQRTSAGYTARISDLNDARTAMDRIGRDMRMAISPSAGVDAFDASSTGTQVTAYINQPAAPPAKVTYQLVANGNGTTRLVRTFTPAVGTVPPYTWPATGTKTTVIANQLVQGSQLLFQYYDLAGAADPSCGAGVTAPCSTPMVASPTISMPGSVGAVEVVLRAQSSKVAPATEIRTRVRVVNANLTAII
jgi:prepilin-type N-terminal cleavage/methylation domain-containing protein